MSYDPSEIPTLSLVIPASNEFESLETLLLELAAAIAAAGVTAEIVLVDDASTDGSAPWLAARSRRDPALCPVLLAERCWQSAALAAGIARARGEIVVTMDAD